MEFIWILFAFLCGFIARAIAMPPLIGYLLAGFLLNFMGMESSDSLTLLSDLGITLMLFTIGLKLNIKDLLKTDVWVSTLGHMVIWIVLCTLIFTGLSVLALGYFAELSLQTSALVGFALSFSSTVCIVKILEESGELKTRHGKLAVAILVMQDIVAVVFMVFATGKIPGIWATALIGLIFLKPIIGKLLEKVGHGELLPLMGFFLAFGGYELFSLVDIKGDLGALIVGVLLAGHAKSTELYKSLMSFKDLFLIGFFLSIGFTALPTVDMLAVAALLSIFIPIKAIFFFAIFTLLNLRARTAFLSSLILSNYSEFGLIVIALCTSLGWLSQDWLVILAIAVSFSFVITSILYRSAHTIYRNRQQLITRFEKKGKRKEGVFVMPNDADVLVIGMGRVGKGTYHSLVQLTDNRVWGIDADEDRIQKLKEEGFRVLFGDAEDFDLWKSLDLSNTRLVLIALPYIQDIINIQEQLKNANYQGKVAAIARYEDQVERLSQCGIDKIFNFYNEAGVGFAEESMLLIK
ncbi:cation:proton antiporter family protein [Pleionea sediminis]|uniref:cation:proton antiporter family protein n=1 Tax=Pleionea sediminis TaxID=2569479 RepID=UPI0011851740|nr:cation:proton antiporter family protein [Pleionea sediminis]